jgi:hypothetical protein
MMMTPLFETGRLVATPGALNLLAVTGTNPLELIERHVSGGWGDVPPEDAKENVFSIKNGFRILSSYQVGLDRLWLLTEADRSSSCLLLPEDY